MGRAIAIVVMVGLAVTVATALFGASSEPAPFQALGAHGPAEVVRDPGVPRLPFPDNPDPTLCGKPELWTASDDVAWLSGLWHGELVEPDVMLYTSHSRTSVTGSAPHGSEVRIIMSQLNPVLDYYYVEVIGAGGASGWVPGPFLSFEPIDT
jgi:hypothetical protein